MRYEVVIVIESVCESSKDNKEIRENAIVQCIYAIPCPYCCDKTDMTNFSYQNINKKD